MILTPAKHPALYNKGFRTLSEPSKQPPAPLGDGPGTELLALFAELSVTAPPGCDCEEYARQMNAWGTDGCRERLNEIVGHLSDAKARWTWAAQVWNNVKAGANAAWNGLPMSLEGIVLEAVRRAEVKVDAKKKLLLEQGDVAEVKQRIAVSFRRPRDRGAHGIGDATNFAHMIPVYRRRGVVIDIECQHDHVQIFRAAGAKIVSSVSFNHPWPDPVKAAVGPFPPPWRNNKNGENLNRSPLPNVGDHGELWQDYACERIDFSSQVTDADIKAIDLLVLGAPRPWIACHTKGYGWGQFRNYPDDATVLLYRELIDKTGGTIFVIDREAAAPHVNCAKIAPFRYFNLGQLYEALRRADLFIGIDSGPLHFLRFTDTPGIGIWKEHYPANFALPRDKTLHCVASHHHERDKYERSYWNTVLAPEDGPAPGFVAEQALRMLAGPRYLSRDKIARDAQLQKFVDWTCSDFRHDFGNPVDRHMSFNLALRFLATRHHPVVVETGTIRSEEDWKGAGFSTYLWSAFLRQHGGELHGVDLTPHYCEFAKRWTREFGCTTIHHRHSHEFLESWTGPKIDLFYSDSADTTTEGYQECCLGEMQRVLPLLADDARIMIDDTPPNREGGWQGKGALAVPWLLERGWEVVHSGWQVLLRKKEQ